MVLSGCGGLSGWCWRGENAANAPTFAVFPFVFFQPGGLHTQEGQKFTLKSDYMINTPADVLAAVVNLLSLCSPFAAIVLLERVTAAPFIFYGRAREPVLRARTRTTIG